MKTTAFTLILLFAIASYSQQSVDESAQQVFDSVAAGATPGDTASVDPNLVIKGKNPDGSYRSEGSVFIGPVDPSCKDCEALKKPGSSLLSDPNNSALSAARRRAFVPGAKSQQNKGGTNSNIGN